MPKGMKIAQLVLFYHSRDSVTISTRYGRALGVCALVELAMAIPYVCLPVCSNSALLFNKNKHIGRAGKRLDESAAKLAALLAPNANTGIVAHRPVSRFVQRMARKIRKIPLLNYPCIYATNKCHTSLPLRTA